VLAGKLTPVVGATFGLSQARQAHEAMLARQSTGKITLDPAL
jgi:NADPH2:quinone reductase